MNQIHGISVFLDKIRGMIKLVFNKFKVDKHNALSNSIDLGQYIIEYKNRIFGFHEWEV
jgi:hypothetical protein